MWNLKRCFKQYPSRVGVGINFTANRKRSSHETVHFISALRSSSIKLPRKFPTRPAPNCHFLFFLLSLSFSTLPPLSLLFPISFPLFSSRLYLPSSQFPYLFLLLLLPILPCFTPPQPLFFLLYRQFSSSHLPPPPNVFPLSLLFNPPISFLYSSPPSSTI